ncbi:hypothetical protein E9993_17830 [Labilibacter sediminis]|nr:hypothetical protein E9993_17830 [Labilibacter sediminis]
MQFRESIILLILVSLIMNSCKKENWVAKEEPFEVLVSVTDVSCYGGKDGSIKITVTGGIEPIYYHWAHDSKLKTSEIKNLAPGTYSIYIHDEGDDNKKTIKDIEVKQPENANIFDIDAKITHNLCNGLKDGKVDLTVNGMTTTLTYKWSNGATTEDIEGVSAGIYTVTINDELGCLQLDTFRIMEPEPFNYGNIEITNPTPGQNDGQINMTIAGGTEPYAYNWSNGATTKNISNISSGWYSLEVIDKNGCKDTLKKMVHGKFMDPINEIEYKTITIGSQTWMAENLKGTKYSNGDVIGTTNKDADISSENNPKYEWSSSRNEGRIWGELMGHYYTWYVAVDSRNVCPDGWHVSTREDWLKLEDHIVKEGHSIEIGSALKGTQSWFCETCFSDWEHYGTGSINPYEKRNDSDDSGIYGFGALPAGAIGYTQYDWEYYYYVYLSGFWWSISKDGNIHSKKLIYGDNRLFNGDVVPYRGYSIRCVKD